MQIISGSGPRAIALMVGRISQGGEYLFKVASVLMLMGSLLSTVYAFTHAHVVQEESTISSLQPKTTEYK